MSASSATAPIQSAASDPYLIRIRDLVYKAAGIFQPDTKLRLLADRCGRRMKELEVKTLRDYMDRLTQPGAGRDEMVKLLNEVTIGETCFFRHQPQLEALKTIVWPRIIAARSEIRVRKLRIWSAGCSTGEEAYTLAMALLEESAGMFKGWTFEIQATDLNERSLEHAKAAIYGDYSVRNVTPHFRQKYFAPVDDKLQVSPAVRNLVSFSRLNLFDDTRMLFMKGMDLIFCANVLIYFDLSSKRRVIQHFYSNLQPHGYFFLGHSESLYGVCDQFKLVHFPSATAYVKVQPQSSGK
ncbi:MAG: protein-glutamate O-methyltransferase CheR [Acidobacteriia bacterium]|nr:protein-glutamate O-methyltransferase CheR [Terriglobia bacterium]